MKYYSLPRFLDVHCYVSYLMLFCFNALGIYLRYTLRQSNVQWKITMYFSTEDHPRIRIFPPAELVLYIYIICKYMQTNHNNLTCDVHPPQIALFQLSEWIIVICHIHPHTCIALHASCDAGSSLLGPARSPLEIAFLVFQTAALNPII